MLMLASMPAVHLIYEHVTKPHISLASHQQHFSPTLKLHYNVYHHCRAPLFSLAGYLKYFEACSAGLQAAGHGILRLGGPAGLFKAQKKHPLCWGLLQHCSNNTDCSLDFISFHKKGNSSSAAILQQDLQLAHTISALFPSLRGTPFANE